ncbi:hypothetical protein ACFQZI_20320 [Mucilaginibacter lutimaris]|uniref:Lipoprotein n=1 Tax=Mucilaginibacter lutimaris TaxID=931629 RepID=A0ABW2ZLV5_9SPHI
MKKEILRLLALLVFGAAVLTGCSIENQGRRGRYDNKRYHGRYHHDNRYNDRNNGYYGRY